MIVLYLGWLDIGFSLWRPRLSPRDLLLTKWY